MKKKAPRDVFESGGNLKHSVIGSLGENFFEEGLKFSVSLFFCMCTEVLWSALLLGTLR